MDRQNIPPTTGVPCFDEILRQCVELLGTKGRDYAAGTVDRLYNFREGARKTDSTMQKVLYIYLWKHLAAVERYCREGKMDSEGLESRVVDAINYLLLLVLISREPKDDRAECENTSVAPNMGTDGDVEVGELFKAGDVCRFNGTNDRTDGSLVVLDRYNPAYRFWSGRYIESSVATKTWAGVGESHLVRVA